MQQNNVRIISPVFKHPAAYMGGAGGHSFENTLKNMSIMMVPSLLEPCKIHQIHPIQLYGFFLLPPPILDFISAANSTNHFPKGVAPEWGCKLCSALRFPALTGESGQSAAVSIPALGAAALGSESSHGKRREDWGGNEVRLHHSSLLHHCEPQ